MTIRATQAAARRHARGTDAALVRPRRGMRAPLTLHQRHIGAAKSVFPATYDFKERHIEGACRTQQTKSYIARPCNIAARQSALGCRLR